MTRLVDLRFTRLSLPHVDLPLPGRLPLPGLWVMPRGDVLRRPGHDAAGQLVDQLDLAGLWLGLDLQLATLVALLLGQLGQLVFHRLPGPQALKDRLADHRRVEIDVQAAAAGLDETEASRRGDVLDRA